MEIGGGLSARPDLSELRASKGNTTRCYLSYKGLTNNAKSLSNKENHPSG